MSNTRSFYNIRSYHGITGQDLTLTNSLSILPGPSMDSSGLDMENLDISNVGSITASNFTIDDLNAGSLDILNGPTMDSNGLDMNSLNISTCNTITASRLTVSDTASRRCHLYTDSGGKARLELFAKANDNNDNEASIRLETITGFLTLETHYDGNTIENRYTRLHNNTEYDLSFYRNGTECFSYNVDEIDMKSNDIVGVNAITASYLRLNENIHIVSDDNIPLIFHDKDGITGTNVMYFNYDGATEIENLGYFGKWDNDLRIANNYVYGSIKVYSRKDASNYPLVFQMDSDENNSFVPLDMNSNNIVNCSGISYSDLITIQTGTAGVRFRSMTTHGFLEFYNEDQVARSAWMGFGSAGTDDFQIKNEKTNGNFIIDTDSHIYLRSGDNEKVILDSDNDLMIYNSIGQSSLTTCNGLNLSAGGMNTTSKYTPAIFFSSSDDAFDSEGFSKTNPKRLCAIVGTAVETYNDPGDGAMALDFFTSTGTTGENLTLAMRLNHTQDAFFYGDVDFDGHITATEGLTIADTASRRCHLYTDSGGKARLELFAKANDNNDNEASIRLETITGFLTLETHFDKNTTANRYTQLHNNTEYDLSFYRNGTECFSYNEDEIDMKSNDIVDCNKIGINTVLPLSNLHIVNTSSLGVSTTHLNAGSADGNGIIIEAPDSGIELFSNTAGSYASFIQMKMISGSSLVDNWSIHRRTAVGDNKLEFAYGTDENLANVDVKMSIGISGVSSDNFYGQVIFLGSWFIDDLETSNKIARMVSEDFTNNIIYMEYIPYNCYIDKITISHENDITPTTVYITVYKNDVAFGGERDTGSHGALTDTGSRSQGRIDFGSSYSYSAGDKFHFVSRKSSSNSNDCIFKVYARLTE